MQTALITGAGRGIGLASAKAFVRAGLKVFALDLAFQGPEGKNLTQVKYNLEDLDGIPGLVESLGEIHVLVNNAGVHNALPYDQYPAAKRQRLLRINLEAPAALMEAVSHQMKRRKSGRIVNLCSIASFHPHPDVWYAVSKAGLASMTKSFASYLGRHGIQVNAVAPGLVDTEMLKVVDPSRVENLKKQVYSGRAITPEEIAAAILWLCTSCPPTVNGSILDINDGIFAR